MTGTQLSALIYRKTKATTTTYTAANMLVDVNLMKDEIASRIQQSRPTVWHMSTLCDLADDQREYSLPSDMLNNIVSLELKFTATGDFVKATHFARRHYSDALQETKIVNDFDNLEPRYFIRRQALYILSGTIITVVEGLKLVYDAFPADLANLTGIVDLSIDPSTITHGFPREFHELLARRVSIEYKSNQPDMKLNDKELGYDNDLDKALDDFSTLDLSQATFGSVPSGSTRGDNGFNY